ncbi:hypothetical protein [Poriferisphaera sp. WC338]|uniref:hypothetical protein n=1 Tax=Poriferisphaera sp. WC338 TaxID=3425129 RepID=UPI003D8135AD
MQYRVRGILNGLEVKFEIEAPSPEAAKTRAEEKGVRVTKISVPSSTQAQPTATAVVDYVPPRPQVANYVEATPPAAPIQPPPNNPQQPQQPQFTQQIIIQQNQAPVQRWSPGVAAVLSFLIPGLGQMYKGQIFNGIAWFMVVMIGYVLLILPGLILHFCCILGAASGDSYK